MLPRLTFAILALAASALAAQSSSTPGVLPPDRAFWLLLSVNGVPTQDIDIDVHFTVSGPVLGRILDLDQYAKLEGAFEAVAASSGGALDMSLTLPARKYDRSVAVELRHAAAGAPEVEFALSATVSAGEVRVADSKDVPMAGFGMITLFHRMVLFDAPYDANNDGKAFTIVVMSRGSDPVPARLGTILRLENTPEFAVSETYGWRKELELFRALVALPIGELRVTVPLATVSDPWETVVHRIFVPCPKTDPDASYRGEMVFSIEMVRPSKKPFETSGNCDAVVAHIRDWTRLGPLAGLAAICVLAACYLRRISHKGRVTWRAA